MRRDESVQIHFGECPEWFADFCTACMGGIGQGKGVEDGGRMGVLMAAGTFPFLVVSAMIGKTVVMVEGSMIGRMSACIIHGRGDGSMIMEGVAMAAVESGIGGKCEAEEEHHADESFEYGVLSAHERAPSVVLPYAATIINVRQSCQDAFTFTWTADGNVCTCRLEGGKVACLFNYFLTAGVGIWHRIPSHTQPRYPMKPSFRHVVSLLMILLVLSLSATCFCSDLAPAGKAVTAGSDCGHCPLDHSDGTEPEPGQCDPFCHCACHAPLTGQLIAIRCSLHVSPLTFSEPHKALPEVYLSKFIPPHQA